MKNKRSIKITFPLASALGSFGCTLLGLLFSLLTTILISNESVPLQAGNYIIPAGQAISSFIGSLAAGKIAGEKNTLSAIAAGGLYFLVILLIGILFLDGVGGGFLPGTIAIILGLGGSVLLLNRRTKSKHTNRRKRRFR